MKNMIGSFVLLIIIAAFMNCKNDSDHDNYNDNKDEEQVNSQDEENFEMDRLDKKMREIMGESEESSEGITKQIKVIQANGAKQVKVALNIGAGKLRLSGGSTELLIAGFAFSDSLWKPQINYSQKNDQGYLSINQPKGEDYNFNNNDKNVWNLKFNSQIPLDFSVNLGAGVSEIHLSDLNLEDFNMDMGVGKCEIDLRGSWKKSTNIHLSGGIGLSKIYTPKNAGIKVEVEKGIGSIDYGRLIKRGHNEYVNELYDDGGIIVTLYLKTGIGRVEIE